MRQGGCACGGACDGAFGASAAKLDEVLVEKALSIDREADCFVLAQASMAGSAQAIESATGKPVFASRPMRRRM
jgi:hypothetical protein